MSKSKTQTKFVGVDDGHSNTKIFAGYDPISKAPIQEIIPSVVSAGMTSFTQISQSELEDATIIIDGVNYTVGSKFAGQGDDLVHDGYPLSGHNVALITQSLRKFTPRWGGQANVSIVTGLPLGHYFDKTKDCVNLELINQKKENVKRIERAYSPADNNQPMFTVVNHSVQPEGWGSYLDLILDDRGGVTEQFEIVQEYGTVIIDIGGRTVDSMVIEAESMTAQYRDVHTHDLGILFLYRDISSFIMQQENLKQEPKRARIDKLLLTGKWGRAERDYSKNVEDILNNFVERIFQSIKSVVAREEAEGGVVITGGGAELLGSRLKKHIEQYNSKAVILIPVDPVYSNARGFWKKAIMNSTAND